jgi:flagellum-specific ATP synthase
VNVIALVGERGREVREFIQNDLGPEGLKRSVMVVATSDDTPLTKIRAAYVATTIAEFFRDQGKDVLLMMDSITRFARAQREIGLANGEPPGLGGFPPSVLALLSKVLERAGTGTKGSITGIYTVLVEGDDLNDPVSDAVRGILDGHIVLSRSMAELNHYPAVDVLGSISRLMSKVVTKDHKQMSGQIREILAKHRESFDLIRFGAYVAGSDPRTDFAIKMIDQVNAFLKQDMEEKASFEEVLASLTRIFKGSGKFENDDTSGEKVPERFNDLLERISSEAI